MTEGILTGWEEMAKVVRQAPETYTEAALANHVLSLVTMVRALRQLAGSCQGDLTRLMEQL